MDFKYHLTLNRGMRLMKRCGIYTYYRIKMKKNMFALISLGIALLFWLFDSSLHYIFYGEPIFELIPGEFNELWMRVLISVLIVLFGVFADNFTKKLIIKEKELQTAHIYNSMIYATHHILNNLLNQMQLVKYEAQNSKDFDQNIIKHYDNCINEAKDLVEKLSSVKEITGDNIWASVDPNKIDQLSENANKDKAD